MTMWEYLTCVLMLFVALADIFLGMVFSMEIESAGDRVGICILLGILIAAFVWTSAQMLRSTVQFQK